jgi:sortase A
MSVLRFFGKLLISLGVGVLLFVLWTLYGTGLYTNRQQAALNEEFLNTPEIESTVAPSTSGKPPNPYHGPPDDYSPDRGDPVFKIEIPALELNDNKGYIVVEGVDETDLQRGPGHYPECRPGFDRPFCTEFPASWPGEKGRVVVSGHRTTYAAPFRHIDRLERGDQILIDTKWGDFTYEVTEQESVLPTSPNVVIQENDDAELVLTTCDPPFSASRRLITYARMVTT